MVINLSTVEQEVLIKRGHGHIRHGTQDVIVTRTLRETDYDTGHDIAVNLFVEFGHDTLQIPHPHLEGFLAGPVHTPFGGILGL